MRFIDARFLADVNIHPDVVGWLRSSGIDVVSVTDVLPSNAADVEVLRAATIDGRRATGERC